MEISLEKKIQALENAESDVIDELKRIYPKGMDVNVILSSTQIYPSGATVTGHEGGRYGYVRVRLHNGKQSVRSVTPDAILDN